MCTCRLHHWKNFYGELNDTSPKQVIDANEMHLAKNRQSQVYDNGDMVNERRKGEGNQHPWFLLLSIVDKMISSGSEKPRSVRWYLLLRKLNGNKDKESWVELLYVPQKKEAEAA